MPRITQLSNKFVANFGDFAGFFETSRVKSGSIAHYNTKTFQAIHEQLRRWIRVMSIKGWEGKKKGLPLCYTICGLKIWAVHLSEENL